MSPTATLPQWLSDAVDSLGTGDIDAWMKIYAPGAVHEFPFAREGAVRRLEGHDEIAAYMRTIPELIRFGALEEIRVREAGDELIVEADGYHHSRDDGSPFDLKYIWFLTIRDGRVSHFRDYMVQQ
jgi:uncharacterized protein